MLLKKNANLVQQNPSQLNLALTLALTLTLTQLQ